MPSLARVTGRRRRRAGTQAAPADDGAIVHALNRLTYGPPGDVERVKAIVEVDRDATGAVAHDDGALTAKLQSLETLTLIQTIQRDYAGPAMADGATAAEGADKDTRATEGTEAQIEMPCAVL